MFVQGVEGRAQEDKHAHVYDRTCSQMHSRTAAYPHTYTHIHPTRMDTCPHTHVHWSGSLKCCNALGQRFELLPFLSSSLTGKSRMASMNVPFVVPQITQMTSLCTLSSFSGFDRDKALRHTPQPMTLSTTLCYSRNK